MQSWSICGSMLPNAACPDLMNWAIVELLGILSSLCEVSWCQYERELCLLYLLVLNFHTGSDLLHLPFSVCRHQSLCNWLGLMYRRNRVTCRIRSEQSRGWRSLFSTLYKQYCTELLVLRTSFEVQEGSIRYPFPGSRRN